MFFFICEMKIKIINILAKKCASLSTEKLFFCCLLNTEIGRDALIRLIIHVSKCIRTCIMKSTFSVVCFFAYEQEEKFCVRWERKKNRDIFETTMNDCLCSTVTIIDCINKDKDSMNRIE